MILESNISLILCAIMTNSNIKSDIIRDFRDRERTGRIALDYDTDVAPLLDCDTLRYERVQGYRMVTLIDELETRHDQSGDFNEVTKVVFELLLHPEADFVKMMEIKALSEFFASLPQQPDVVWGFEKDASLTMPIELRVLTV